MPIANCKLGSWCSRQAVMDGRMGTPFIAYGLLHMTLNITSSLFRLMELATE